MGTLNNNDTTLIPKMTIQLYQHILFPKISQFTNTIHNVKQKFKNDLELPIIEYIGRVKLHGTNSSIVLLANGSFYCQSRNRIITPTDDNAGFAQYVNQHIKTFTTIIAGNFTQPYDELTIYGEWCGGNIQSGVAIAALPRMFIVFAIRLKTGNEILWMYDSIDKMLDSTINLYHTGLFRTYNITIDFNQPHLVQKQLIEYTEEVEKECPAGKYFGVSGLGEGLVFHCNRSITDPELWSFKSKGEKHSQSKVKTIGVVDIKKIEQMEELVNYLLYHNQLENRPAQAIRVLKESGREMVSMQDIKPYIDWIAADIIGEHTLEIDESGLKMNDVISTCIQKAKQDYKVYLNKLAGLLVLV